MRGMYLTESLEDFPGLRKKINSQLSAFNTNNIEVTLYELPSRSKWDKLLHRLPFLPMINIFKESHISDVDFVYIRKPSITMYFILLLRKLKKKNIKIILEIPTFPYDDEIQLTFSNFMIFHKERNWREKLKKYVDRIVTYSDDKIIFGIETLNISNGIDINNILVRTPIEDNSKIHIIAVANHSFWHGYDRFINGMGIYYKRGGLKEILLHIVGNGEVINNYKKLARENNIENKVIFYGEKSGKDLDSIYNQCSIGLDAMGRHRSNVFYNSSLKGKEYSAKGLPIISGVKTELDSDQDYQYYMRVPADETYININDVVSFFDHIYSKELNRKQICDDIRQYAVQNFDIKSCMMPIINYLKRE